MVPGCWGRSAVLPDTEGFQPYLADDDNPVFVPLVISTKVVVFLHFYFFLTEELLAGPLQL